MGADGVLKHGQRGIYQISGAVAQTHFSCELSVTAKLLPRISVPI